MTNTFENMTAVDKAIFINNSISTHEGKMAGIPSISTSALVNEGCKAMRENSAAVCANCYACKYLKLRKTLREKTALNTEFYTTIDLNDEDIPRINASFFRFESFGDLANVQQFKNYVTIAFNNEHCTFALWSKRPEIVAEYERKHALPENLNIIYSSHFKNDCEVDEVIDKYDDLFSGVFTVYTPEYATKKNININCGDKKCIDCGLCYTRELYNANGCRPAIINELLK